MAIKKYAKKVKQGLNRLCLCGLAAVLASILPAGSTAAAGQIALPEVGQYVQLGSYQDAPILWKCIKTDDPNGILLLSDKLLCFKAFDARGRESGPPYYGGGSNLWEESTLRAWLNSTAEAGKVVWPGNNPPVAEQVMDGYNPYDQEAGFLSDQNFSEAERSLLKSVSQWIMLPIGKEHLATNGRTEIVNQIVRYGKWPHEKAYIIDETLPQLDANWPYSGAMYKVTDTMFLLSLQQVSEFYILFDGDIAAAPADPIKDEAAALLNPFPKGSYSVYWLRTPFTNLSGKARTIIDTHSSEVDVFYAKQGVRPAFYLNTDRIQSSKGSGTAEDPYIYSSETQKGLSVFFDGSEIGLGRAYSSTEGVSPLLPLRPVFEALGAQVEWQEETQSVRAGLWDGELVIQIGNPVMYKNGAAIPLDTVPVLQEDRTMIPLSVLTQGFGVQVDWIADMQRIVIATNH